MLPIYKIFLHIMSFFICHKFFSILIMLKKICIYCNHFEVFSAFSIFSANKFLCDFSKIISNSKEKNLSYQLVKCSTSYPPLCVKTGKIISYLPLSSWSYGDKEQIFRILAQLTHATVKE